MRRLSSGRAKELSITPAGANRRVFAMYKSVSKPPQTESANTPPPEVPVAQDLSKAISNIDPDIWERIETMAKAQADEKGSSFTPQAASVVKAMGRLLTTMRGQISMGDLQKIGEAVGLDKPHEAAGMAKSKVKGEPNKDSDDDDYDGADSAVADEEEADSEDEGEESEDMGKGDDEEEEEEDKKPALKKSTRQDVAPNLENSQSLNKSAADTSSDEDDDEGDADEEQAPRGKPPRTTGKATKPAKGGNMAKTADDRIAEIMAKHQQLTDENKALREEMQKSRKDLDDERNARQLEALTKSVKADYANLTGLDVAKIAPMLKAAKEKQDQGDYEFLTSFLKSCNEQVRAAQETGNVFATMGKSSAQHSAGPAADWDARIEARVREEMKKSGSKDSFEKNYAEFTKTGEGRDMRMQQRRETRSF